jgi:Na+/alanine symporter
MINILEQLLGYGMLCGVLATALMFVLLLPSLHKIAEVMEKPILALVCIYTLSSILLIINHIPQ